MTDLRKAAEQALKYFEDAHGLEDEEVAIREALRQALAQPVDLAKVAEVGIWGHKRQWVGLSDEEIQAERHKLDTTAGWTYNHFARAIEAKLREKNHG